MDNWEELSAPRGLLRIAIDEDLNPHIYILSSLSDLAMKFLEECQYFQGSLQQGVNAGIRLEPEERLVLQQDACAKLTYREFQLFEYIYRHRRGPITAMCEWIWGNPGVSRSTYLRHQANIHAKFAAAGIRAFISFEGGEFHLDCDFGSPTRSERRSTVSTMKPA